MEKSLFTTLKKQQIYNIKQNDARRAERSVQRQQSADERIELHQEIMRASDRDKNVFFQLIKNQRFTSSQFTQVLRENDKEASTLEDINVVFKDHYAKLAK